MNYYRTYTYALLMALWALSVNAGKKEEFVPKRILIDETALIIHGPERERIVCLSEIDRLSIDGRKLTKDHLITEELLFQETIKYKVPIDEAIIDKYLANIQKDHKVSIDQIKDIFKSAGYTYAEGRDQLRMMYASNMILDNKIRARLIVPEKEVIAYYEAHPVMKEPKYLLEVGHIPFDYAVAPVEQQKKIQKAIDTNALANVSWREPFWIIENDLSDTIDFVTEMAPGQISKPLMVSNGFEVYKLRDKKPMRKVALRKRYHEIVSILQRPVFDRLFVEYKKELFDNAYIVDYTLAVKA
jgi:parvulin-like peptidyl-prolyl isomerase